MILNLRKQTFENKLCLYGYCILYRLFLAKSSSKRLQNAEGTKFISKTGIAKEKQQKMNDVYDYVTKGLVDWNDILTSETGCKFLIWVQRTFTLGQDPNPVKTYGAPDFCLFLRLTVFFPDFIALLLTLQNHPEN